MVDNENANGISYAFHGEQKYKDMKVKDLLAQKEATEQAEEGATEQ